MSVFDMGRKFVKNPQSVVDSAKTAIANNGGGNLGDLMSKATPATLDPSAGRLLQAGLNFGGANVPVLNSIFGAQFAQNDKRVRLSLSPGSGSILYKDPSNRICQPLVSTGGVLFPYTPVISISRSASYGGSQPTHSNYMQHSYGSSAVDSVTIDGLFTANDPQEATYVLAVLQFMRSAHKMFFGEDRLRGTPPPVLRLSGYGTQMLNSVPVVIQNYVEILANDRDMIEVPGTGSLVPSSLQMTISLLPIYSKEQIGKFSLEKFARGDMVGSGSGSGGML